MLWNSQRNICSSNSTMKNVIIIVLFYFTFIQCEPPRKEIICEVNQNALAKLQYTPLYLNQKFRQFYPGTTVVKGNFIKAYCTNQVLAIKDKPLEVSQMVLRCINGSLFETAYDIVDIKDIRCVYPITALVVTSKRQCFGSNTKLHFGFNVSNHLLDLYSVCYNFKKLLPLMTKSYIHPLKEYINFRPLQVYRDCAVCDFYKPDVMKATITKQLRKKIEFIDELRNMVYDKGHLAPQEDFFYEYQRRATYCKFNIFPIWRPFYALAWQPLERFLRSYAAKNNVKLTIYTGILGTLRLNDVDGTNVEISLTGVGEQHPIPALIWKIAYDREQSAAVAIIGINSYLQRKSYNDLCQDISSYLPWLDECATPYIYACKFDDWRNVLNKYNMKLPAIEASHILGRHPKVKKEHYSKESESMQRYDYSDDSDFSDKSEISRKSNNRDKSEASYKNNIRDKNEVNYENNIRDLDEVNYKGEVSYRSKIREQTDISDDKENYSDESGEDYSIDLERNKKDYKNDVVSNKQDAEKTRRPKIDREFYEREQKNREETRRPKIDREFYEREQKNREDTRKPKIDREFYEREQKNREDTRRPKIDREFYEREQKNREDTRIPKIDREFYDREQKREEPPHQPWVKTIFKDVFDFFWMT